MISCARSSPPGNWPVALRDEWEADLATPTEQSRKPALVQYQTQTLAYFSTKTQAFVLGLLPAKFTRDLLELIEKGTTSQG